MENTGFKGLAITIYQRVVRSYKTTLIGLAVMVGGIVAENLVNSENKTVTIVGSVIGGILVFVKEKYPPPPAELPPASP